MPGKNLDKITKETVKYVAHLARIELDERQLNILSKQLKSILDFIDKLKEVNIDNIKPTSHIITFKNVFRVDKQRKSLEVKKTLKNAPEREENFFTVPKVIE